MFYPVNSTHVTCPNRKENKTDHIKRYGVAWIRLAFIRDTFVFRIDLPSLVCRVIFYCINIHLAYSQETSDGNSISLEDTGGQVCHQC